MSILISMLIDIKTLQFFKYVNGIIHIGAHNCEERFIYLSHFNNLNDNDIVWIDAISEKVDEIKKSYPTIQIFNECISNTDNELVTFNITNNLQSSSFLNLKEHLIEHPDIYNVKKIEMKTKSLKTFYNENNFSYDRFNFMALDIQGAELLALKGAKEILNFVDFIYLEVNTKELYENCALLDDVEKYLSKYNFQKQNILMTEHGWGDAFYVKNKYSLLPNYKIEYGIENNKIDITNTILKEINNNHFFHVPKGDEERALIFGDPIFGIYKNIYISDENNKFIISPHEYINIDINGTIYINSDIDKKKFCVMAIFKNETMNLKIWLDHYLWQGVEHFYLIDNGSTDYPMTILQEYIDKGIVSYYFKPEKYNQVKHYREVFDSEKLKKKTKWLCICDLDEFFFGIKNKLIDVIENDYNDFDVIYTHSFFYGSDNLIEHPKDIRTSIVYRQADLLNGIKYIFKPSVIKDSSELWIHWLVNSGTLQKKYIQKEINNDDYKFRLNHYNIQSLEYYANVKMIRGDADLIENEKFRDIHNFILQTKKCTIKDDILKNIIENNSYNN